MHSRNIMQDLFRVDMRIDMCETPTTSELRALEMGLLLIRCALVVFESVCVKLGCLSRGHGLLGYLQKNQKPKLRELLL